ncbi:hypothetical protein ACH4ND_01340 [Streptomyces sp. NPDC017179]|uniref:hypothetical protein n=1 Tax=Streptomyces sp. NPDC017179 TaxID=3364979 RepID=UPI0037B4C83E
MSARTTIEHGTLRGWRQHKRHGSIACDPCAAARRLSKQDPPAESTQRARQQWNRGMVGDSRPATSAPVIETCTVDGCGITADQPAPSPAMVRIHVPGSTDPARWYCPGRCAAIGRALADLRSVAA